MGNWWRWVSNLLFQFFGLKLNIARKSQIAIAYIYWLRRQQLEMSTFWIHASTIDRFRQGYLEIAQRCQIPGVNDSNADILQLVKNWLLDEKNGEWLMVIDNADDSADFFKTGTDQQHGSEAQTDKAVRPKLNHYIPKCTHGSILVTTRSKEAAFKFANQGLINVTSMSATESEDLISTILKDEDCDPYAMKELASLLDYLPLALKQAAAYIRENSSSVRRYLEIYHESEDSALELLELAFESEGRDLDIPNAVATSWMISFDQIRSALPRAADILSLIAFFDRQAIPESLLRNQDEPLSSFDKALGKLLAYSLITRNVGNKHFDEHRLVHLISRAWLRKEGKADKWFAAAQERILERFPKEDYKDWDICVLYLPHARAVIDRELKTILGTYNESINSLMVWVDRFLNFQGSYSASTEACKQRLNYCLKHLGPEHLDTLTSINNLAMALYGQGQYAAAEKLHRRALAGWEKTLGPERPVTLMSVNNLALTLGEQGQHEAAEKLHRQALAGWEKTLGPEHLDTLTSVNNLATALYGQGQYEAAEKLHRRALASREKKLGPEHPDTLRSVNNLAPTLDGQGQYEAAEKLYRRALAGWEKTLGPEHPDSLTSANNLAGAFYEQGQYEAAEKLYRRALAGREKTLGPEHPDTLTSVKDLAVTLRKSGQKSRSPSTKEWLGVKENTKT
jgi:tetratricopeptide (TPR) repeat protein